VNPARSSLDGNKKNTGLSDDDFRGLQRANAVVAAAMRWFRWKVTPGDADLVEAMTAKELLKLARACSRLNNLNIARGKRGNPWTKADEQAVRDLIRRRT